MWTLPSRATTVVQRRWSGTVAGMRIYVSSDIEGVAGVVSAEHQSPTSGREYERARSWMTSEVNAAIDAAFDVGATEVWVNDAHGPNTNLLVEALDDRALLITGKPKRLQMVEGIDADFDAAMFLGYHARTGVQAAVLDHAYIGIVGHDLSLNGVAYGEFGLNALIAGHHGVPVVAASGDDKLAAEARAVIPGIEVATVKHALGRTAARTMTPAVARREIAAAVRRALTGDLRRHLLVPPAPPYELQVTFHRTSMADAASVMPGSVRTGGCTVCWHGDDLIEAFRACRTLLLLATTAV